MVDSVYVFSLVAKAVLANAHRLSRSKQDILADIRFLRFDDDGVIELIDRFIAGSPMRKSETERRLTGFNDQEWNVANAVARLAEEVGPVARLTREDLRAISDRKISIRRQVQDALNDYGRRGFAANREDLVALRGSIAELNDDIDRIEQMLMHGTL